MASVRAFLHGGPLNGRMVTIDVEDPQDPPILYELGYVAETLRAQVEFRVYRRAARSPYAGRVWDYEATGEVRRVNRPVPPRSRWGARRGGAGRGGAGRGGAGREGAGRGSAEQATPT